MRKIRYSDCLMKESMSSKLRYYRFDIEQGMVFDTNPTTNTHPGTETPVESYIESSSPSTTTPPSITWPHAMQGEERMNKLRRIIATTKARPLPPYYSAINNHPSTTPNLMEIRCQTAASTTRAPCTTMDDTNATPPAMMASDATAYTTISPSETMVKRHSWQSRCRVGISTTTASPANAPTPVNQFSATMDKKIDAHNDRMTAIQQDFANR
jgi:hypothetical protein